MRFVSGNSCFKCGKMKSRFYFFVFLILPFSSFSQDSCRQFATGIFTVQGENYIKIKRTCKYQYENNTSNNIRSKYRIEWLDDCTYKLTMIRTTNKIKELIGVSMIHKIIKSDDNSYTYFTQYSYMSRDRCGTIGRHIKKEETIVKTD